MLTSAMSAWPVDTGVVDLEFDTREGRLCLPLDRCATFSFELDCRPVRGFPSYHGQRNFPGLWWFSTTGAHVGHESWLERDQLMVLDADPDVIGVVSQPFWFRWPDGVSHAPDYFVRRRDGSAVVVDVRDDDRISAADQEKFDRSAVVCETVGWDYRRVGVLDSVLRANLRWLSGYRHPRVFRAGLADSLVLRSSADGRSCGDRPSPGGATGVVPLAVAPAVGGGPHRLTAGYSHDGRPRLRSVILDANGCRP